jgi:signal peptidase I
MHGNSGERGSSRMAFILSAFTLAAIFILIVVFFLMPRFSIVSASMAKTLQPGDRVLAERVTAIFGGAVHRGDVVIFRWPPNPRETYIHRVVAIPGDRVQLKKKQLYLNGVLAEAPYVQHMTSYIDNYRDNFPQPLLPEDMVTGREGVEEMMKHVTNGELVIPEGCYFLMGDNRDDAADSRYFGFIRREDIVGRPLMIYTSKDASRIGKRIN